MKLRYVIFVPYLIFIGMMEGNIVVEAMVIGIVLGMYDFLFSDPGGGRSA
tara:strand:+ start:179 stop:328 length:150 start_codon:yes stop_codon:yes gene_type:complete